MNCMVLTWYMCILKKRRNSNISTVQYGPNFLLPYQSKNLYQHNRNRRKVYILIGTNKLSQIKVEVLYTSVIWIERASLMNMQENLEWWGHRVELFFSIRARALKQLPWIETASAMNYFPTRNSSINQYKEAWDNHVANLRMVRDFEKHFLVEGDGKNTVQSGR
jgi:hypothetical protein